MFACRGIRGAVRADHNTREAIIEATRELLTALVAANQVEQETVASIFLTTTPDLNAEFPAYVLREMGWSNVPLLCAREINVPHGMKSVVRVLMHVNTEKSQTEIRHIYLGETAALRPDLAEGRGGEASQP